MHTLLQTQTPFNHWPLHRSHIDCRVKGRLKLFSQASKLLWSSTLSDIAKICSKVCETHPVQLEIQLTTRLLQHWFSLTKDFASLIYYSLLSVTWQRIHLTIPQINGSGSILFSEARALEIRNPSRCERSQTQWDVMFWQTADTIGYNIYIIGWYDYTITFQHR